MDKPRRLIPYLSTPISLRRRRALVAAIAATLALSLATAIPRSAQAAPFPAVLPLSGLDGSSGFRLDGVAANDLSGFAVSAAGDINGDGLDDLIVGAFLADPNGGNSGSSYVVFGKSTGFTPTLALSALTGTNGFRLDGAAAGDYSGRWVSAAGDINGDGFDDLIVGAYLADPNGSDSGSSYVVFGKSTFAATLALSSLTGADGFRLDGVAVDDRSGRSVSAAGDINGDGFGDLIVGAYHADPNGSDSGSSYVVFGKSTFAATLALSSLTGANGFRLDGAAAYDRSGRPVSAAGDINGDGFDDLIVGALGADPNGSNSGSSYVVFGKSSAFAPTLALSDLTGSNGFRLDGAAAADYSGRSVSAVGDMNGDGFDDLIVGTVGADPNGSNSGSSYVVFGKSTFTATLALSSLTGTNGFRLDGAAANDYSGISVSAAGDINSDALDDLIIGAVGADPNGNSQAGSSYVVFGKSSAFAPTLALSALNGSNGFRLDGAAANDHSGISVSAAGDINGDGVGDLIVGAYRADPNGSDSGSGYVVFGRLADPATIFRNGFE